MDTKKKINNDEILERDTQKKIDYDEILEKAKKKFICTMRWYILITILYLVLAVILLMEHYQNIIIDFVKNNKPISWWIIAFFSWFLTRMLSIHAELDNKERLESFSILEAFFNPVIVFTISWLILDISLCKTGCNAIITTSPYFLWGLIFSCCVFLFRGVFISIMKWKIKREKQRKEKEAEETRKKKNEEALKKGYPMIEKSDA